MVKWIAQEFVRGFADLDAEQGGDNDSSYRARQWSLD
jgi:hypothetical protein